MAQSQVGRAGTDWLLCEGNCYPNAATQRNLRYDDELIAGEGMVGVEWHCTFPSLFQGHHYLPRLGRELEL